MRITIKPKYFIGSDFWYPKSHAVIFVENEDHIDPLYQALVEQDDYWDSTKNLIKVAPEEINDVTDLDRFCEYTYKTDIYDVPALRTKMKEQGIEFIIYHHTDEI